MKKLVFALLFIFIGLNASGQVDSIFLIDTSVITCTVKGYNDTSVSFSRSFGDNKKIRTTLVQRVVLENGLEIIYKNGIVISSRFISVEKMFLGYNEKTEERIYLAGYHLKASSNYFIGAGVAAGITLLGFSYAILSRPDTAGLLQNNKLPEYLTAIDTWEGNKRDVVAFATGVGLLSTVLFLVGSNHLSKASAYLTNELALPISIRIEPNKLALVYRF